MGNVNINNLVPVNNEFSDVDINNLVPMSSALDDPNFMKGGSQNSSPLGFTDRLTLAFSDDIGKENYLKNKFRFVEQDPTGMFIVGNEPGNLKPIDPKGLDNDVFGDIADMANDAIVIASSILGGTVGSAIPGFGTVGGSAAGAGIGEAANVGIGKTLGVRQDSALEQGVDIVLSSAFGAAGEGLGLALKKAGSEILKPQVKMLLDKSIKNSSSPSSALRNLAKVIKFTSNVNEEDTVTAGLYEFNKTLTKEYSSDAFESKLTNLITKNVIEHRNKLGKAVENGNAWAKQNFGKKRIDIIPDSYKLLEKLREPSVGVLNASGQWIPKDFIGEPVDKQIFDRTMKRLFAYNPKNKVVNGKNLTVEEYLDAKKFLSNQIDNYFSSGKGSNDARVAFAKFFEAIDDKVKMATMEGLPKTAQSVSSNPFISSNAEFSNFMKKLEVLSENGLDLTKLKKDAIMSEDGTYLNSQLDGFIKSYVNKSQSTKTAFKELAAQLPWKSQGGGIGGQVGTLADEVNKWSAANGFKSANPNMLRLGSIVSMLGLGYGSEKLDVPGGRFIGPVVGAMIATPAGAKQILKLGERAVKSSLNIGKVPLKKELSKEYNRRATLATLARLAKIKSEGEAAKSNK